MVILLRCTMQAGLACRMGRGISTHTGLHASKHTRSPLRIPAPARFSGDSSESVDDYLFSFENYLTGNQVPRDQWTVHATALLSGPALEAWTAAAHQARRTNQPLTWGLFVDTLTSSFTLHNRALDARRTLHTITQRRSLHQYTRLFRLLVSCCSEPPSPADQILFYINGLQPHIKAACRVDPTTGKFWTCIDALIAHALLIAQSHPSPPPAPLGRLHRIKQGRGRGGGRHNNAKRRSDCAEGSPAHQHKRGGGRGGGWQRGGGCGGRGGKGGNHDRRGGDQRGGGGRVPDRAQHRDRGDRDDSRPRDGDGRPPRPNQQQQK